MPCLVPNCPTRPGPSGFCAFHQNRLNARANGNAKHMTDADRVAIAAHPGWRGRAYRLMVVLSSNEKPRYTCVNVEATRRMWAQHMRVFDVAAEALAELDRRNGVATAARVARLEADLDADRRDNCDMWCALDAIHGITVGRFPPPAAPTDKPTIGSVAIDKVAALKRRLDEVEAEVSALKVAASVARAERNTARAYADAIRTHRDALEERRRELAADNGTLIDRIHDDRWAHAYAIARMSEMRAALDKQAATVAGLRSELAERERDVTDLCAERDEYLKERDEARFERDTLAIKVNGFRTLLTLARRPWWRKVWAWVAGGAL